jgi:nickel-type superoxide dismutase maturation protease
MTFALILVRHYSRPDAPAGRGEFMPLPYFTALVQGPSMVPTLRHGDALLVRRGGRVRPGDVVVARFRSRPDLLVVKRAVRPDDGGWWVRGDNALVTDDSRRYGVADPIGRVVLRYWPRPGRIR